MTGLAVIRAEPDAGHWAAKLNALGYCAYALPSLRIGYRSLAAAEKLPPVDALAATSAFAVRWLAKTAVRRDVPFFAVGSASAARAQLAGFSKVYDTGGGVGGVQGLAAVLAAELPRQSRIGYFCAAEPAGDLAASAELADYKIVRTIVYDAQPAAFWPDALRRLWQSGAITQALFFSPRGAAAAAALIKRYRLPLAGTQALCFSPAIAAQLQDTPFASVRWAARRREKDLLALLPPLAIHYI